MVVDATSEASARSQRARVFISYSRSDKEFADRLEAALKACGIEPFMDRRDIYAFEDWWQRIQSLIAQADTVVFVLSPDAVGSPICLKEVAFATSLNKRFAPIVCHPVSAKAVPEALRRLQFISFDQAAGFNESLDKLVDAISTDIEWIRKHTEFGQQARRWELARGPSGLLLRSPALEEAEQWIASRPQGAPLPTLETQMFVQRSRQAATRRRNLLTGSLMAGLILALGLASAAVWQWNNAVEQRKVAQAQRDAALLTESRFLADVAKQRASDGDAGTAMSLAIEALPDTRSRVERPYAPEAEEALYTARQRLRELAILAGHRDWVRSAAFNPDGRRVLTWANDKTVRIWNAETARMVAVLTHDDAVASAVFSADGRRVLTTSWDKTARIWDTETGKSIAVLIGLASDFPEDGQSAPNAEFSADGRRVVTRFGNTVRIWDVETGQTVAVLSLSDLGWVGSVAFSPDGRRVLTWSKTPRIWDIATRKAVAVLAGHSGNVTTAAFSPDGRRVVTASDDKTARIWDAGTGKAIVVLTGHEGRVGLAAFSPDGRRVLISDEKAARIWDAGTGRAIAVLAGYKGVLMSAAFSPDGRRVVTSAVNPDVIFAKSAAFEDNTAHIWDAETGSTVALLVGHEAQVSSGAFSPDGRHVITASWDKTARIWDAAPEITEADNVQREQMNIWHEGQVLDAAFSPDGRRLLMWSNDKKVRIWDIETGKTIVIISEDDSGKEDDVDVWRAAFSLDARRVIVEAWSDRVRRTVRIWDTETGQQVTSLGGFRDASPRQLSNATFSPDGQRVFTWAEARIWDPSTGQTIAILSEHEGHIRRAVFSPDGRRLLILSGDNKVRTWDRETGKAIAVLTGHEGRVRSVAFSPDGRRVLTDGAGSCILCFWTPDNTARVWDAETGRMIAVLIHANESDGLVAVFSPDGRRVLTWSKTARIWDTETGKAIAVLAGHAGNVLTAAFSPDGRRVITVSDDKTARIWDTETGKAIAVLTGHEGRVGLAAFSPDGRRVLISNEKAARIWRLFPTTQDLIDDAKRVTPRCLTPEQRERFFLDPDPPAWCKEMQKWPFVTED